MRLSECKPGCQGVVRVLGLQRWPASPWQQRKWSPCKWDPASAVHDERPPLLPAPAAVLAGGAPRPGAQAAEPPAGLSPALQGDHRCTRRHTGRPAGRLVELGLTARLAGTQRTSRPAPVHQQTRGLLRWTSRWALLPPLVRVPAGAPSADACSHGVDCQVCTRHRVHLCAARIRAQQEPRVQGQHAVQDLRGPGLGDSGGAPPAALPGWRAPLWGGGQHTSRAPRRAPC